MYLDFALNLIGLYINKFISKDQFAFIESISNEFIKPIIIQTAIFALFLLIGYVFVGRKKLANYFFVLFQTIAFHAIFFINLGTLKGAMRFICKLKDPGLGYLSNNGQYLTDLISFVKPVDASFTNGLFMPESTLWFYVEWILLVLIYFALLTWLTVVVSGFFFKKQYILPVMEPVVDEPDNQTTKEENTLNENDDPVINENTMDSDLAEPKSESIAEEER
jgi:hypothetical protein